MTQSSSPPASPAAGKSAAGLSFAHIVSEGGRTRQGAVGGRDGKRASTLRLVAYVLAQVDRGERVNQHVLELARDFVAEELELYR